MRSSACLPSGAMRMGWAVAVLLFLALIVTGAETVFARPGAIHSLGIQRHSPDWMSTETAARLEPGFEVLVPAFVPAPFTGEPAITSQDGYYSLYWMVPGSPPTFLQITGELGGAIPDYSKFDRNIQLVQNAEVAGHPAYHDLTPIYDLVYWKVGDVLYTVESRNLAKDDSLGLANALVSSSADDTGEPDPEAPGDVTGPGLVLPEQVESGAVALIGVLGSGSVTLSADAGYFSETGDPVFRNAGGSEVSWVAPTLSEDAWVLFVVADGETGEWLAWESALVLAALGDEASSDAGDQQIGDPPLSLECPGSVATGDTMEFILSGSGYAIVDAGDGTFPVDGPNSAFAPAGDTGRTLTGTVPDSGSISLIWNAPEVSVSSMVYLFATSDLGQTTGECAVEVVPLSATDADGSSGGTEAGEATDANPVAAADIESGEENTDGASQQESPGDESKATEAAADPGDAIPTPVSNEVRGLPTAVANSNSTTAGEPTEPSPTATVNRTPTVRPTATIAPTTSEDGMVASIIGPGGGTLASPLGATLVIPEGALTDASTVSIRPVANTQLPVQAGVELIPSSGFDVAIAGPDGRAILALAAPAELRIEVGDEQMQDGIRLYRIDGVNLVPLANTRIDGNVLMISLDGLSRFVAGVPLPPTESRNTRSLLPFVLAAMVVVVVMVAMVVLGGMFRPRRHRVVSSSRSPRSRSRYR